MYQFNMQELKDFMINRMIIKFGNLESALRYHDNIIKSRIYGDVVGFLRKQYTIPLPPIEAKEFSKNMENAFQDTLIEIRNSQY